MPFQPAPNVASIEFIQQIHGQVVENTYHMVKPTPFTGADLVAAAPTLYSWWGTTLATTLSTDVTLLRVELKALDTVSSPFASYTPGALSGGAAGVAASANNVAWVIKHTTAYSGRSGRGRWYLVGIPMTLVVNSAISLGQAALYTSAFPTLDNSIVGLGYLPCVLSRTQGGVVLPVAIPYPITGHGFTDTATDSQRRRLPGRGS